ncbi:hypothetical protein EV359DRAFT_68492, partial [Lentinula novae-zelandiae]
GVVLFKISGLERVRTFAVPSRERRSRNVAFHDNGNTLITGSDHGVIYVFDRRTGDVVDTIYMGVEDWVQSVATTELNNIPTIILGQSGDNTGEGQIQVWQKQSTPAADVTTRSAILEQTSWVLCIVITILFVLEHTLLCFAATSTSQQP